MAAFWLMIGAPAWAQSGDSGQSFAPARQCEAPGLRPERGQLARSADLPLRIDAREFSQPTREAPLRFSGDVRLARGDQLLETDELSYDRAAGIVELPGWLRYQDATVAMEAARARYDTTQASGDFSEVRYRIAGNAGAGHAREIRLLDPSNARVTGFDFTTCDVDDPDWQLKAGRVKLDFERNVGTAKHARLEFKGVPILYSPWLSFPLTDERKSGFLYPRAGTNSDNGLDISIPYYFNLRPNMDATLTPRWIAERGGMLGSEFRFLTLRQRGTATFEWLPDDDKADRDRWFGRFDYRARLARRWSASLNANRASDDLYFIDLGSDLEDSAVQFLRSSGQIRGQGRHWTLSTLVDTFQVLDEDVPRSREPFSRLPRIEFAGDWPLQGGLAIGLDAEAVYFDRSVGVTGGRFDLMPELSWRRLTPGYFIQPALALRATGYSLSGTGAGDDSPARVTPIASLDAGLVFERQTGAGRTQTLEPRLFYVYVPFREQDDLPSFDTSELTFGFARLFSTNRFTGPDRQSDANQITLALTSRLLDEQGQSRLDLSVGQILFFEDQQVQLAGRVDDDRNFSIIVSEAIWRPGGPMVLAADLRWDPEETRTEVAGLSFRWQGQNRRQIQLGYRFRRNEIDQIDLRARFPVWENVHLITRYNYSFEESQNLEILGGIEYESCCWALNLTARHFVRDRESDTRTSFFLELHLKGLGSLGRRPYRLFDN